MYCTYCTQLNVFNYTCLPVVRLIDVISWLSWLKMTVILEIICDKRNFRSESLRQPVAQLDLFFKGECDYT